MSMKSSGNRVNLDLEFTGEDGYPLHAAEHVPERQADFAGSGLLPLPDVVQSGAECPDEGDEGPGVDGRERVRRSHDLDRSRRRGFDLAQAKRKWYLENYGRDEAAAAGTS